VLANAAEGRTCQKLADRELALGAVAPATGRNRDLAAAVGAGDEVIPGRLLRRNRFADVPLQPHGPSAIGTPAPALVGPPIAGLVGQ